MISTTQLADVFVEVADTLVADFDLPDFLLSLTEHAANLSGAASVGLLLVDHHDRLQFMAATDQSSKALELFQIQASEGPCLDAFHTRRPVVNADLANAADRWPRFAPRARQAGYQSVHALPMRWRDQVIGALNLFGSADHVFAPHEVGLVQAIADVATIALLQERSITRAETLTEQLQGALNSRIVIEQAKGAFAQKHGVGVDEAFTQLRQRARSRGQSLVDVCREVLEAP